ncbi:MAG: HAMP domain-containing protein, partial [Burkholderiaceae bacterium]|nr:HAMP domain-containing protein [Burkholderiaceae bacterium]
MTTAWVVTIKTVDMAKEEAFNLAAETADKYKNEIKAELQGARVTSETLSTVFETLKTHNLTSRHMMNDILQKALKNKEYITILCIAYMPNALDGKDHQYAGVKPAYSPSGRYALYWNKLGSRIELEPLPDKDIEASDWWNVPKTTKHEFITDPYLYHIQGHPVMLASLVFPILYQGEFIGIIASDIALDKLQEMVSRKNTHISGGYTQIFSNSGSIVAHSDKRYLGKNISETLASSDSQTVNEVKDAIKNGKTYVLSGNDFYTVYTPIHFSEVTRPWSVAVSIPMADVLQRANYIRNYIIAVFAFFVVLLAIVLYLLTRSLTQPIRQLADAARELGEGNFNVEMPLIKSNDEIGMLSRTFRSMVAEIDSLIG